MDQAAIVFDYTRRRLSHPHDAVGENINFSAEKQANDGHDMSAYDSLPNDDIFSLNSVSSRPKRTRALQIKKRSQKTSYVPFSSSYTSSHKSFLSSTTLAAAGGLVVSTGLALSTGSYAIGGEDASVTYVPVMLGCSTREDSCTLSTNTIQFKPQGKNLPRDVQSQKIPVESSSLEACLYRVGTHTPSSISNKQEMFCQPISSDQLNSFEYISLSPVSDAEIKLPFGTYVVGIDGQVTFSNETYSSISTFGQIFTVSNSLAASSFVSDSLDNSQRDHKIKSKRLRVGRYVPRNKVPSTSDGIISLSEQYVLQVLSSSHPASNENQSITESLINESLFVVHGNIDKKGRIVYAPNKVTRLRFDKKYHVGRSDAQEKISDSVEAVFATRTYSSIPQTGQMSLVVVNYQDAQTKEASPGYDDLVDQVLAITSIPFSVETRRPNASLAFVSGVAAGAGVAWLLQPKDTYTSEPGNSYECNPGEASASSAASATFLSLGLSWKGEINPRIRRKPKETNEPIDFRTTLFIRENPQKTEDVYGIPFLSNESISTPKNVSSTPTPSFALRASSLPLPEVEKYADHGRFVGPVYDANRNFIGNYQNPNPHESGLSIDSNLAHGHYTFQNVSVNELDVHVPRRDVYSPLASDPQTMEVSLQIEYDSLAARVEGYTCEGKIYDKIVQLEDDGDITLPFDFATKWNSKEISGYQITIGRYFETDDEKLGLFALASSTVGQCVEVPKEHNGKYITFISTNEVREE